MKLYIVATPIGNLGDISMRAVEILRQASLIICENVPHSQTLLKHYQIQAKLTSYNDKSDARMRKKLLQQIQLLEGYACLISDAGTPLISDPGYKLIAECMQNNITVSTIPGACAAIAALTLSALPTDRFIFLGFLGNAKKKRVDSLSELKSLNVTAVIYETGKNLANLLEEISSVLPSAQLSISREITKLYEETMHGTILELQERIANYPAKGEFVVCVAPILEVQTEDEIFERYKIYHQLSAKELTRLIQNESGLARNAAYKIALNIVKQK